MPLHLPPLATDCHQHLYDPRFPLAPWAKLRPAEATLASYHTLLHGLGLQRHVLVQPSTYGTDNRLTLEALARCAPGTARGIAVLDDSVEDATLRAFNRGGIRGLRFNQVQAGATTVAMLPGLARRIAPLGWHVQLNMNPAQLIEAADLLASLPCPLVLDHMGHLPQPEGTRHPAFAVICRLLDTGRVWVKLSGAYLGSQSGPPGYADTSAVARALWQANPERMVWGSDWPHPTEPADAKPDAAQLLALIPAWVGDDPANQRRLLTDNPSALYFS